MYSNPFTPVFGGKPDFFFGRRDILERFDRAMVDQGSEDRALFFTGTRGSGKTALLEQLSMRAVRRGWKVIDLGSENTIELLVSNLVRQDEETRTLSPQANVSVLGTGLGVSAGSVSKSTRFTTADLQLIFLDACVRAKGGLFVSIDEVQKVSEPDLTAICDAFQMASRKGCDVMLAVAGLPYAHAQIIQYTGCTYLRRAAHEVIGLFSREEARDAFAEAFDRIEGLALSDEGLSALTRASYGHPYLMQLLGYYLVLACNERAGGAERHHEVSAADVEAIVPAARDAYERRALAPILDELTDAERAYLVAMSQAMGDEPMVRTGAVAKALGRDPRSVGKTRESLLHLGLVASPEYGSLVFAVPHLRQYVVRRPSSDRQATRALEWGL